MVLPPKPLHSSPVPPLHTPGSSSFPSSSSLEISQQLQRVETLHQQLKAEAQRAHDFLVKLRRGELEARTQAQLHAERRQRQREEEMERRSSSAEDRETPGLCTCSCPHQPALSSPSHHLRHHQTYGSDANHGMVTSSSSSRGENHGPSLGLHSRVDEREVRDLEKRVRGLEGRVRGFEGLPPDREMALLEVERLRRELEMLAKKKGGFAEGFSPQEEFAAGLKREGNGALGPEALQNGGHGRHTSTSAAATMAKD